VHHNNKTALKKNDHMNKNNTIAITGYGISLGGFENENSFLDDYINGATIAPEYVNLEILNSVDDILEQYIRQATKKSFKINRFRKVNKGQRIFKTTSQASYSVCVATMEALKKAKLEKLHKEERNRIGTVLNSMHNVLDFGDYDGIVSIKSQWEQQSPSYIGNCFKIQGPHFAHREGENSDLLSIETFSNLINTETSPIMIISSLSAHQPMYKRLEAYEDLRLLKKLISPRHKYLIPMKHSEMAISIILEDYEHAKRRGARVIAELKDASRYTYKADFTNSQVIEDSLSNAIKNTTGENKEAYDIIFGSLNQNCIVDESEYKSIKKNFNTAKLCCSRKLFGCCHPASGSLSMVLALLGFETGYFPASIKQIGDILNEDSIEAQRIEKDVHNILIQSLSRSGTYASISLSRPE